MALVIADRVLETTTTAGSGTITLVGAKIGYQSFSVIGNGNTTYYTIALQNGAEWEVGIGTYTSSGTTLSRDTVLASSAGGAKVTFSAGTKDVFVDYPAEKALYPNESGNISALSGKIINLAAPTDASDATTKQYVDTIAATGITYHTPVKYEVPNTTGNLNATYNQPGGAGVGVSATLTNAGTLAAFVPDGITASISDRILIYNQTSAFQNGVYTVTVVGDGSTAWVLTRSTDTNSYALKSPTGLGEGDAFFVTSGNTGAGETYVCNTSGAITFGTTAINFVQVSSEQIYSAGNGLTLTNTTFALDTPVSVPNGGSGATTLTGYVKGNGTAAFTASATIPVGDLSGTVGFSQGGTGQTTQQTAIDALAGAVTSGYYLRGDGTHVGMSAIQAGDVPTLNQNTTGSAGSVANALTINNAGAGDASGTTYNGSAAKTISYNSIGAAPSDGSTTITKLGTITTGTWNAGNVTASGGTITATNIGTLATTQFQGASASITTISGTTSSYTNVGIQASTQFQGASANITTISSSSANITTLTGTSATITTMLDSVGNVRNIPRVGSQKTSVYTLAISDIGQYVEIGTGGGVDVPNGIFNTGNAVTIFNNTTGNRTISLTITTAYIGGTDADKNSVTLATRGLATILFISNSVCVVNGNVT